MEEGAGLDAGGVTQGCGLSGLSLRVCRVGTQAASLPAVSSCSPQNMEKATLPSVTLIVGCGVSSLTLLMLVIIYVSVWRWVPRLLHPTPLPLEVTGGVAGAPPSLCPHLPSHLRLCHGPSPAVAPPRPPQVREATPHTHAVSMLHKHRGWGPVPAVPPLNVFPGNASLSSLPSCVCPLCLRFLASLSTLRPAGQATAFP